jgi:hypothetical protein
MDLGSKPIIDFSKHKTDTEDTNLYNLLLIPLLEHEGLQDDKPNTKNQQQTIPEYIHPAQHRPAHHRPDLVKAIGYTTNSGGHLIRDPTFRGRRQLQLIECKYSTDGNIQEVIDLIYTIYEPLKQALQAHGTIKTDVVKIRIVISRTGTFNVKTLAKIVQLGCFKEDPPNALTYKQLSRPAKQ